jgi:hypothetical protein
MVEVPSSGGGGRWRKIRKYKVEDRGHLLLSGMKAKTGAPSSLSTTTLAGGPGADAGLVEAAQRWSRISRTRLSCNEGSFLPLRMRMFSKRDQNSCQSLLLSSFQTCSKNKDPGSRGGSIASTYNRCCACMRIGRGFCCSRACGERTSWTVRN